jgi:hypothetical protein
LYSFTFSFCSFRAAPGSLLYGVRSHLPRFSGEIIFKIHLEVFYKPTLEERVRIAGFRWRFLLIANGSTRPYIPAYADFHPVAFRLHFEFFLAVIVFSVLSSLLFHPWFSWPLRLPCLAFSCL